MSKLSGERVRKMTLLLGESASPFIGEGDGLTSLETEIKRERACYLVLLPMPSGTRQLSAPTILLTVGCMWLVSPYSSSMANVGAYHSVG